MKLDEALEFIKFKYTNYHNDPNPNAFILDKNYDGDWLGWNLNYIKSNKKKEIINKLYQIKQDYPDLDKLSLYNLIIKEIPEIEDYIRRYKKDSIKRAVEYNKKKEKFPLLKWLWSKVNKDEE